MLDPIDQLRVRVAADQQRSPWTAERAAAELGCGVEEARVLLNYLANRGVLVRSGRMYTYPGKHLDRLRAIVEGEPAGEMWDVVRVFAYFNGQVMVRAEAQGMLDQLSQEGVLVREGEEWVARGFPAGCF